MTALTLYGSNIAATTITTAGKLSTTTGGTETSQTTNPSTNTSGFVEFTALGGSSAVTGSLPSPTGKGWLLDSTLLEGRTIATGNWSVSAKLNDSNDSWTGIALAFGAWKRSSGGIYTSIGTITISSQNLGMTAATFSFPATSFSSMAFATGDKLYVALFANNTGIGSWPTTDNLVVFESSSGTVGVPSDVQVTTPGYSLSGFSGTVLTVYESNTAVGGGVTNDVMTSFPTPH